MSEAPIVVANHIGPVEPIILAVLTWGMPVAAIENASIPFFGALTKIFLPIFIDRQNPDSRDLVKQEIESRAKAVTEGVYRHPLYMFPEGTTTNGTSVINFKTGAFNPRLPVQPLLIQFPHTPGHIHPSWGHPAPSLLELIFRLLCEPYNRCRLTWLPKVEPVSPDEMTEWPGPKIFANRVQRIFAEELGTPTTQYSFEDMKLMQEALKFSSRKLALEQGGAAVELKVIQSIISDLDIKDAKACLKRFHSLAKTKDGELTYEEFEEAMGVNEINNLYLTSKECRRMFDLLDDDQSGRLNFREFLVGVSLFRAASPDCSDTFEEVLKFCFRIYDTEGTGKIDYDHATHILRAIKPDGTEEEWKATFNEIDKNDNETLEESEFVAWAMGNGKDVFQHLNFVFSPIVDERQDTTRSSDPLTEPLLDP